MEIEEHKHTDILKEYAESDHTEEMQDIISAPPSWLVRWGILVFFFVLILIINVSVFVHYPELVKTTLILNTETPPIPVVAQYDCKLIRLQVAEHQIVSKNTIVATIEASSPENGLNTSLQTINAGAEGEVFFSGILLTGQHIKPGQEMIYIVHPGAVFFGEMIIPQANIAKVRVGQAVHIKLKSYPFQDYGILEGQIDFISEIANSETGFMSRVRINYHSSSVILKNLKLKPGMTADAEIVTEDASLFKRMTNNLFKAFH